MGSGRTGAQAEGGYGASDDTYDSSRRTGGGDTFGSSGRTGGGDDFSSSGRTGGGLGTYLPKLNPDIVNEVNFDRCR